jgi:hypothetical protein
VNVRLDRHENKCSSIVPLITFFLCRPALLPSPNTVEAGISLPASSKV